MSRASTRVESAEKVMRFAETASSRRISPGFQRVTVTGEGLRHFTPLGFDQWFRLFLPQPGSSALPLPKNIDLLGYARYLLIPKNERPVLRNYTVSAFRPATVQRDAELDIDFALHGDDGFASAWAASTRPGDRVAVLDEGLMFRPPADTQRLLIVSDETGLPAVAGIGRSLAVDAVGDVILEVGHREDSALVELPSGMRLHLIERSPTVAAGLPALARLTSLDLDVTDLYAMAIGESALATGARRHLTSSRGLPKSHVAFCGYWRNTAA